MRISILLAALTISGCQGATTKEGCPIYLTEIMQAQTEACVAAYYEQQARAAGGVVTRCSPVGGSVSCVTY